MMATSFEKAFENTIGHEGGYVNRADDRGGETYKGITRKWYPDWPGWAVIDSVSDKSTLADILPLNVMVQEFYLHEFWDKIKGYALGHQGLADLLFDAAVHTGVPDANKYLQSALNFCNRNQKIFDDLKVDGLIGNKSLMALGMMGDSRREMWAVIGYVLLLRGEATLNDLRANPDQEINAVGWMRRLDTFMDKDAHG